MVCSFALQNANCAHALSYPRTDKNRNPFLQSVSFCG
jgi:hypothetical protein